MSESCHFSTRSVQKNRLLTDLTSHSEEESLKCALYARAQMQNSINVIGLLFTVWVALLTDVSSIDPGIDRVGQWSRSFPVQVESIDLCNVKRYEWIDRVD